ncbi:DUF4148 domain-containing protein [Undibacterium sp.]|uniref:DUF4148 domain-containing protein n=1 Tax=Undibacterium sp. TaxID=1914977 RepID=UPI002C56005D|nr:DUF4148 domain-containing protein [Undibacterium sp.]HTD06483.1 DUF4148 domain-containing protein [Undibacterium sp.]
MKAIQAIAALAMLLASGISYSSDYMVGGENYVDFPIPSMTKHDTSARTDVTNARFNGQLSGFESNTASNANKSAGGKTRAEVINELVQARAGSAPVSQDTGEGVPVVKTK